MNCANCGKTLTNKQHKFCSTNCSNLYHGRLRQAQDIFDPKFIKRFWQKVRKKPKGCWVWIGAKSTKGHGHIYAKGRFVTATRIAYEFTYGIDPGQQIVFHRCNNNSCVRPDHLCLNNMSDRCREMVSKGLYHVPPPMHGEDNPRAKLTQREVKAIRAQREAFNTPYDVLADRYGVSTTVIWAVIRRRSWKHVD